MGITRRSLVKGVVALSSALVVAPFGALYKYLNVPVPTIKIAKTKIANKKDVPVNSRVMFSFPTKDRPAILLHIGPDEYETGDYKADTKKVILNEDRFEAYDAVCTHLGCPVGWLAGEKKMGPSCHGARFSPLDGSVRAGPPPRPIPKIKLEIDNAGDIYAVGYESGLPLFGMESYQFETEK